MIGRFLKNALKGVVKSIPVVNLIYDTAKDLNRKDVAEKGRRLLNSEDAQKAFNVAKNKGLKQNLYNVVDMLDDGKINESFDRLLFDRIQQILSGATALGVLIWQLLIQLGWI